MCCDTRNTNRSAAYICPMILFGRQSTASHGSGRAPAMRSGQTRPLSLDAAIILMMGCTTAAAATVTAEEMCRALAKQMWRALLYLGLSCLIAPHALTANGVTVALFSLRCPKMRAQDQVMRCLCLHTWMRHTDASAQGCSAIFVFVLARLAHCAYSRCTGAPSAEERQATRKRPCMSSSHVTHS